MKARRRVATSPIVPGKKRYEVTVVWCVDASSESEASTCIWDCIDGHIGIVAMEAVRMLEVSS